MLSDYFRQQLIRNTDIVVRTRGIRMVGNGNRSEQIGTMATKNLTSMRQPIILCYLAQI